MKEDFSQRIFTEHALIAHVITQSTLIESIIDAYIAEYYTRCPNGSQQERYLSFLYDIMSERAISLDTKKNILFKIFKRLDGKKPPTSAYQTFEKWLSIRNKFAHGRYIPDAGILYGGEFFNVEDLANQHASLQIKINDILQRYHNQLVGSYFNQIPLKEATQ